MKYFLINLVLYFLPVLLAGRKHVRRPQGFIILVLRLLLLLANGQGQDRERVTAGEDLTFNYQMKEQQQPVIEVSVIHKTGLIR